MIIKSELFDIAKLKGINNKGYAEKDYLLELVLFSLSKNIKQELVFKGGTALYKFFKLDRFSEDLDFSEVKNMDIDKLIKQVISDISKFKVNSEVSKVKEPFNSVLITLRTKGPLYDGTSRTFSNIRIDINKESKVELEPTRLRFTSLYPEIPSFYALVMQEKEILAEKIRAIITRNKARDLYDAFELISKKIEIDKKLIEKKMAYYNQKITKNMLSKAIDEKEKLWSIELKPLLNEVLDYGEVRKKVLSEF